jgi:predicted phosphodiesterase
VNLEEALAAPPAPTRVDREKPYIPKLGEPGTYEWDGEKGVINTQPTTERVTEWDDFLKDAFPNVDPAELEVLEPVQVRGWDAVKKEKDEFGDEISAVVRMHYYRLNVVKRRVGPPIADLISLVKKSKPAKKAVPTGDATYVVAIGDLQLGKIDGDGIEGTVKRVIAGIDNSVARIKQIRKNTPIEAVHVAWLGDCIEGFVSQGGANAWRTSLTLTEQVRLLRRIMFYAADSFAPLAEQVSLAAVPGNHDQSIRFGKGGVTRYDDSHDVDALSAVADACELNPAAFGHVSFYTPAQDELTLTLESSGTIIGHAHGHQMRNKQHMRWWSDQSFGDQAIGEADILLTGHFHHFVIEQTGKRTFIMVPALEQESTWWRHSTGITGNPGVLNFVTAQKKIASIEVV